MKNGRRLIGSQYIEITGTDRETKLKINDVTPEDIGYYTLVLENPCGVTLSSAYLTVDSINQTDHAPVLLDEDLVDNTPFNNHRTPGNNKILPPKFVRTSSDSCHIVEGKMARFDCRIISHPSPEVTWYINDVAVVNDDTHKILADERDNNSLLITNVDALDHGVVTCIAHNLAGDSFCQFHLNVINQETASIPKFDKSFNSRIDQGNEPKYISLPTQVGSTSETSKPTINGQKVNIISITLSVEFRSKFLIFRYFLKGEVSFTISPGSKVQVTKNNGSLNTHLDEMSIGDTSTYENAPQDSVDYAAVKERFLLKPSKQAISELSQYSVRPVEIMKPTSVSIFLFYKLCAIHNDIIMYTYNRTTIFFKI